MFSTKTRFGRLVITGWALLIVSFAYYLAFSRLPLGVPFLLVVYTIDMFQLSLLIVFLFRGRYRHNFEDGMGSVRARRHRNPDGSKGGWVAKTASVSPQTTIGRYAVVFGRAEVLTRESISEFAKVRGVAKIEDDARLSGVAVVEDSAVVRGGALVSGDSHVSSQAVVSDNAQILSAYVSGKAEVSEHAKVIGAKIDGKARVSGTAEVSGSRIHVSGDAVVSESARIFSDAVVHGDAVIAGGAVVSGGAVIRGHARVCDQAYVKKSVVEGTAVVGGNTLVPEGSVWDGSPGEMLSESEIIAEKRIDDVKSVSF